MSNELSLIITLLIGLLFDLCTIILLLRFLLQLLAPNYYNPFIRKIFKCSIWLNPLHRFVPIYKNFDAVVLVFAIFLQVIKIILLAWLHYQHWPQALALMPWTVASIINLIINIFFYGLLLRVLLSYLSLVIHASVYKQNTLYEMLYVLTEPLLQPFRKWLPTTKNWDFSPLLAAILLKAIAILLIYPLLTWAELQAFHPFI